MKVLVVVLLILIGFGIFVSFQQDATLRVLPESTPGESEESSRGELAEPGASQAISTSGVWVRSSGTRKEIPSATLQINGKTVSGDGGFFPVPSGKVLLAARADGYLPMSKTLDVSGVEEIQLDPAARISVVCRSLKGFHANVPITVMGPTVLSGITGITGEVVFDVPPGVYRLRYHGRESVKDWVPSAASERFARLPNGGIRDRLSAFPESLSGEVTAVASKEVPAELILFSETGVRGEVEFPPVPSGYRRSFATLWIEGRREASVENEEIDIGSYTERKRRLEGGDGYFEVLGLKPGRKMLRASACDIPEQDHLPILYSLVAAPIQLTEGEIADLGVVSLEGEIVTGKVVFHSEQGREIPHSEVTTTDTPPEAAFYIEERGVSGFARVYERLSVPIGRTVEIWGVTAERVTVSASQNTPPLSKTLIDGVTIVSRPKDVQVGWQEDFLLAIPLRVERATKNILFSHDSSEELRYFVRSLATGEVKKLEESEVWLEPGTYSVLATPRHKGGNSWGFASFEANERLQTVRIFTDTGVTVTIELNGRNARGLQLVPTAINGKPWPFGKGSSPFLASVTDGKATFEGVPHNTPFELVPVMGSGTWELDEFFSGASDRTEISLP